VQALTVFYVQDVRRRIHYYDDEMSQLLRMISHFAAELVEPEFEAVKMASKCERGRSGGSY
jgi:hypothetical protein